jgi:hypothetical protein
MQDEQQPPSNEELRMITREPRSPAGETRDAFTTLQVVERKNREIQGNKCPRAVRTLKRSKTPSGLKSQPLGPCRK